MWDTCGGGPPAAVRRVNKGHRLMHEQRAPSADPGRRSPCVGWLNSLLSGWLLGQTQLKCKAAGAPADYREYAMPLRERPREWHLIRIFPLFLGDRRFVFSFRVTHVEVADVFWSYRLRSHVGSLALLSCFYVL